MPSSWVRLWPAARGQGFSEVSPLAAQSSSGAGLSFFYKILCPACSLVQEEVAQVCVWGSLEHCGPGPPVAPSLWLPGECIRRGKAIHHCLGLRNSGEGNSSCPYLSLTQAWLPILEGEGNGAWRDSTFAQTEENSGPRRLRKVLWRNKPD